MCVYVFIHVCVYIYMFLKYVSLLAKKGRDIDIFY